MRDTFATPMAEEDFIDWTKRLMEQVAYSRGVKRLSQRTLAEELAWGLPGERHEFGRKKLNEILNRRRTPTEGDATNLADFFIREGVLDQEEREEYVERRKGVRKTDFLVKKLGGIEADQRLVMDVVSESQRLAVLADHMHRLIDRLEQEQRKVVRLLEFFERSVEGILFKSLYWSICPGDRLTERDPRDHPLLVMSWDPFEIRMSPRGTPHIDVRSADLAALAVSDEQRRAVADLHEGLVWGLGMLLMTDPITWRSNIETTEQARDRWPMDITPVTLFPDSKIPTVPKHLADHEPLLFLVLWRALLDLRCRTLDEIVPEARRLNVSDGQAVARFAGQWLPLARVPEAESLLALIGGQDA